MIWWSELELFEEDARQLVVVMLAGVHDDGLELARMAPQFGSDGRDLRKIGPCAGNKQDLQGRVPIRGKCRLRKVAVAANVGKER